MDFLYEKCYYVHCGDGLTFTKYFSPHGEYMNDFNGKNLQAVFDAAEADLAPVFKVFDDNCAFNSEKVLNAFIKNRVSQSDFTDINGYGYYDGGRDKLEKIFAEVLDAEDSLVRPQIMSGTNAIALSLTGLLHHGDTMLSVSGLPYDSLRGIIGISGESRLSLTANGVKYEQIDLVDDDFDYDAIEKRIKEGNVTLVAIQRSRGYAQRKSLTMNKIEKVVSLIKSIDKNVVVFCDNCYGELVERREPCAVGVDIIAGSLMKNLGGGVASSGGYVAGRKDLVAEIAERLTAPGIGKELGANFNQNLSFYKGLFLAPNAVRNALKTAAFAAYALEKTGFKGISPASNEERTDIIQTVELGNEENLVKFCQGMQENSPVDSFVSVEPGDMPGYPDKEVMAAGTFTQGSTIELSCDGPVTAPYTAYLQGGLTYEYGKAGIVGAIKKMFDL